MGMWGFQNYLTKRQDNNYTYKNQSVDKYAVDNFIHNHQQRIPLETRQDPKAMQELKNDVIAYIAHQKAYDNYFTAKRYVLSPHLVLGALAAQSGVSDQEGINQIQNWLKESKDKSRYHINEVSQDIRNRLIFSSIMQSVPNNTFLSSMPNGHIRKLKVYNVNQSVLDFKPSKDEIIKYHSKHKDEFVHPMSFVLKYVEVSPKVTKPSNSEIEKHYSENKELYKTPESQNVTNYILNNTSKSKANYKDYESKIRSDLVSFKNINEFEKFIKANKSIIVTEEKSIVKKDFKNLNEVKMKHQGNKLVFTQYNSLNYTYKPFNSVKAKISKEIIQQKTIHQLDKLDDLLDDESFSNPNTLSAISQKHGTLFM